MASLDKNKPYGIVCGGGELAFEQDGCFFNIHGEQVGDEQPVEAPKNKGGRPKKVEEPVADEIQAQIDANLAG